MDDAGVDILDVDRGSITAPAGCGKTELIVSGVARHVGELPILILTHTNAGVSALRRRLKCRGVPQAAYHLSTIDGWSLRMATTFPVRSGLDDEVRRFLNPRADYPRVRTAATRLIRSRAIDNILAASYGQVVVDEYQDCSTEQHEMVSSLAGILQVCILGDPLQAIFGFRGTSVPDWEREVCERFPVVAELDVPWRWINAGEEDLGRWLLAVRQDLARGATVDLTRAPAGVRWVRLTPGDEHASIREATRPGFLRTFESSLIVGDSTNPKSHGVIAKQTPGAVTVDAVQMGDLIDFATTYRLSEDDRLARILEFAGNVMVNVNKAQLARRIRSLEEGRSRRDASTVEIAGLALRKSPTYRAAAELLLEIGKANEVRKHRPAVFWAGVEALRLCEDTPGLELKEAALRVRERARFAGRGLPTCAVGSTLLLKGLEAEAVIILNADDMNRENLYVALTRGARHVTVCSKEPVLKPSELA